MEGITKHELFDGITPTVKEDFEKFHEKNPHIADLYLRFAREMRASGRHYYGSNSIFERIRWHVNLELDSADEFAINSKYSSCYSRLITIMYPEEFKNFFSFRTLNKYKGLHYEIERD
jgi:hypothetical protein